MYQLQGVPDRRRRYFTLDVLNNTIPSLVAAGTPKEQIAKIVGCKVSTLVVTCSKYRISLDQRRIRAVLDMPRQLDVPLNLLLSEKCRDGLVKKAGTLRLNVAQLTALLLEQIVNDGLIDAVLDLDGD